MLAFVLSICGGHGVAYADGEKEFVEANAFYAKKDYLAAYAKWRYAADRGHAASAHNIAHLLRYGQGVKMDHAAALIWYRKGADGGVVASLGALGSMYEYGLGVKADKAEALKWYRKAVAAGNNAAASAITRLTAPPKTKPKPASTRKTTHVDGTEPMVGEIRLTGVTFAPRGWAYCDGQLLPIAQNQALFSILGTMYGGDGRTTFGLPDLRGRAPMHSMDRHMGKVRYGSKTNALSFATANGKNGTATPGKLALRYIIALHGVFPSRTKSKAGSNRFVGEIVMFAGNFSPYGWYPCDGRLLSTAQNKSLYAIIGKTYGEDEGKFRIPDLRGRFAAHVGSGEGLTPLKIGQKGGGVRAMAAADPTKGSRGLSGLGIHMAIVPEGVDPSTSSVTSYLGELRMLAGGKTPRNWATCDGQRLPISLNTALFSLFGTTYGGDGRTTFSLPGLRGRVAIHAGRGPGLVPVRQGSRSGGVTIAVPDDASGATEKTATADAYLGVRVIVSQQGVYPSRN